MYSIIVNFQPVEKLPHEETYFEISWYVDCFFDYRYPFRVVIEKIVEQLSLNYDEVKLLIEPYEEIEEFIHFFITLNGYILKGYYEHSLCYLSLKNDRTSLLRNVRRICNEIEFQAEGYQGEDLDRFDPL